MKKYINTHNEIIGFHCWENATGVYSYLRNRHRHNFVVKCLAEVEDSDREIEFNEFALQIETAIKARFGYPCEFGSMSCENIAEWLLEKFDRLTTVTVQEDNYGGATLTR